MSQLPHILFVDDEPHVLSALQRSLREFRDLWQISVCDDPYEATELIAANAYDTIVTDIRMPGMDGFELLRCIRSMPHREDVPVIVLTGNSETDLKRRALDLGATDLLNKPVATQDLVARLRSALRIKQQQDQLKVYATQLEGLVDQRTRELADSRLDILWRLGKAAEQRDEDTGHHIVRVSLYSRVLAEALQLDSALTETLFVASPLHDVGKIGIPDHILLKPGRLDDSEYTTMRRHTVIGAAILRDKSVGMAAYLETSGRASSADVNPLLEAAAEIAMTHHERWDGGGYPHSLRGEAIPLVGRVVALADVYDALSSKRPYKPAFPESQVVSILISERGRHFDPQVVSAFEASLDRFREIRSTYRDPTLMEADGAEHLVR